jgi:hypothetical protein
MAAVTHSSPSSDLCGTVLGDRYRVVKKIGIGGFGAVYQAVHVVTGRSFAIKVLLPEFSERPKFAERFMREATTTARIEHENVVDIIDVGRTDAGHLYFTMELLRGETLEQTLAREERLSWPRARAITMQICDGLRAAHDRGIIHRDLKPANIYRVARAGNADFIKILDFGIAKLLAPEDQKGKGLTSTHEVLGTPLYMSPEQTAADPLDRRSDIYAVGVMLFEMLTGTRPYSGETQVELMSKILLGEVPRMAEVAPDVVIPAALEAVVVKAMARKPTQRFFDMNAMIAALAAIDERGELRGELPPSLLPVIEAASEDTMLASTPPEEVARTQVRHARVRRDEGARPLLAAALVVLGLVTVTGAMLAAGERPEAQALAHDSEAPAAPRLSPPLAPIVIPTSASAGAVTAAASEPTVKPPNPLQGPQPVRATRPRPAPACESALASAVTGLSAATVRRCTSGDRLKLQLSGNAGGLITARTLESSGSRDFDACLIRALAGRHLPADASPSRCQRAVDYRVP